MMVDKRAVFHHDVADQQVDDLRERMRLLQQDRRANIDLLESNKVANGNEVQSLKEDNKKLRMRLSNLQKSAVLDHDSRHSDVDGMKKLVLQKRNEFDTQKSVVIKLSAKHNKLKDEAKICRLEEQRPNQDEGPLSRQIRSLENRLDKAMIQYNEAHGICSTYDHIVKRLKEERVSFDNQLTALERTMESKHRDFEELAMLSGDASHAREIAHQNLQKSKWALEDNKNRRSRDIRERQQHVKIRKQMVKKHEKSDEERRKALDTADYSPYSMTSPMPIGGISSQQQIADQEHDLNAYEHAFRKIKDATGVSNVNEVIRKVVGQESTTENLNLLTTQNQSKMEDLTQLQESLVQDVEKIKYNVPGSSKSTKTIDAQQELLYLRSSLFERTRSQFDRLAFVLVSIKAGVEHLRDKLASLPGDEFEVGHGIIVEDTLLDVIRSSGDILVDVHAKTKDSELQMHLMIQDSKFSELKRSASRGGNLQNRRPMTHGATEGRPFNQRISLPSAREVSAFDENCDAETVFADIDVEEEISRDGVKKASSNIIAMEERRQLRSRNPDDG
mmetsp:Transcript_16356/g.35338  ORF Transcript_16356/g.35338 Transcript_16356/m.35338 type:complete len:560 (-) Transcript_16356:1196-2875(-)|eukprot:CAMPEP_0172308070 /NCGR_PEP_ID=MMETSP1058-20130122/8779_1 /TAXON_ID=83371 /ORGANISM="Detonula confervacea, Strain CCMP 353" /LENGTH=559 /DNA_ID=CAMNT_0013020415 /DNA_START=3511 /DNA_END=5190 /DNA_ORIENTATION=-